jgi:hypothetical protein
MQVRLYGENAPTFRMQNASVHQFVNGLTSLKGRIELNERLRPQNLGVELLADEGPDARVENLDEAACIGRVVVDQPPA